MTPENLKILLCDDNKQDRTLIKRQLKKEFKHISVLEAGTAEQFKSVLKQAQFQLAIVDYKLNWTTGLKIVEKIKEIAPECPIIMFTATGSEEIAVKAMKSGVDDYIIKSLKNFVPLLVAVKTALKARREKIKYEKSLISKEQNYHKIFETAANFITSVDINGYILDCNQRAKEFLGYEKSELIGKNMAYIIHPDFHKTAQKNLKKIIKHGVLYNERYKMVRKDGTEIDVNINSSALADSTGKFSRTICLIEDITSQMKSSKRLLHLNNVLASIRNVNQLITHEKNIDKLIEKSCRILTDDNGYYNAWIALLDRNQQLQTTAQSGLGNSFKAMVKLLKKGNLPKTMRKALKQNSIVITSDPSVECMDCPLSKSYLQRGSFSARLVHNKIVYGIITVSIPHEFVYDKREQELFLEAANDIAFALYSIEIEKTKDKTAKELIRSQQMLQRLTQNMPGGFVLIDKDYRIHQVNHQTGQISGFSKEELEGELCDKICPKGSNSKLCPIWEEGKDGFSNMDTFIKCKDGSRKPILKNAKRIELDGKEYIIENFQTTTNLKRIEKELQHSQDNLRATLNSIGDAVISTDTKGNVTALNPVAEELTGYAYDEAVGQKLNDIFHIVNADTRKKVISPTEKVLKEDKIVGLANHTVLICKDGTEYQIADSAAPIKTPAGETVGVVMVFRDVTQEYNLQQQLTLSEKRFSELFATMTEGVCEHELVYDSKGRAVNYRILKVNPAYEDHLNLKREDILGKLATEAYQTEEPPYIKVYKKVATTKQPVDFETYFQPLQKYFQISVFCPAPGRFATIFSDITKRKLAQKQLVESENKFRTLVDQAAEMLFLHDTEGNIVEVNKAAVKNSGYSKEELLQMQIFDLDPEADKRSDKEEIWQRIVDSDEPITLEVNHKRKDGSIYQAIVNISKVILKQQEYILALAHDITKRKQAEEARRESDERFRIAQEMSPDGFTILHPIRDEQGNIIDFSWIYENKAVAKLNGTDPEEIVGKRLLELFPGHRDTQFMKAYKKVAETGEPITFEQAYSGESMTKKTWFRIVVVPMAENIAVLAQDITERKKAEETRREIAELLRSTIQSTADGILVVDNKRSVLTSNKIFAEMWEIPDDLLKTGDDSLLLNYVTQKLKDPQEFMNKLNELYENPKRKSFDTVYFKDGRIFERYSQPLIINDKPEGRVWSFRDVTKRKKAEAEVKRSKKKLERTLEATTDGIWSWNFKTDTLFFSPNYYKMLGYEPNEFQASFENWLNMIHPDDRKQALAYAEEFLKTKPDEYENEFRVRTKSNDYRWVHTHARVVERDQNGEAVYMIGNHQDITERKRKKHDLIASEARYRRLFETARDGILILDAETGIIQDVNPYLIEMMGFSREEFCGKMLWELGFFQDIVSNKENLIELQKKKYIRYEGLPLETADGQKLDVEFISNVYLVDNQKVIQCNIRNITERKKAEAELRRNEKILKTAQKIGKVGSWELDLINNRLTWSDEVYKIFGLNPKSFKASYEAFLKRVHPEDRDSVARIYEDSVIKGQDNYEIEHRVIQKNTSEVRYVKEKCIHEKDKSGKIIRSVGMIQDITERKQAEKELKKIEWLLEKEEQTEKKEYAPSYGDITTLNTERTILDNVGKPILQLFAEDLMNLLDTSVSIYEKNGDYAFGMFQSGWCRLMDHASRQLCPTDDNKEALNCGKWLCHENCWNKSAKTAMKTGETTDIDCIGGIKLYAEPIYAGNEIIGTVNIGYGNPPSDEASLQKLADRYKVDIESLKKAAEKYKTRPPFIIEAAKQRLSSVAKMLGTIVESKRIEKDIKQKNQELQTFNDIAVERELVVNELRREVNELLLQLGKDEKYDVVE